MTNFKKALLAASALTLMSGAALAQTANGNVAYVEQRGNDNESVALQSGNTNLLRLDQGLERGGNNNVSRVEQSGNNNRIGSRNLNQSQSEIQQDVDGGDVTILQASDNNIVNRAYQRGIRGAAGTTNRLAVVQGGGDGNEVTLTVQRFRELGGLENALVIGQAGTSNLVTVAEQNGVGNDTSIVQVGSRNVVREARQGGFGVIGLNNASTIEIGLQGNDNRITSATQGGLTRQAGVGNGIYLSIVGDSNGEGAVFTDDAGTFRQENGIASSTISQRGSANVLSVGIVGNDNGFGFKQEGNLNTISGNLGASFASDVFGIQDGNSNFASFSSSGTDNSLLFRQFGDDNILSSSQLGTGNLASVTSNGDGNGVFSVQDGTANSNLVIQNGDGNFASVQQIGNGNDSTVIQGSSSF